MMEYKVIELFFFFFLYCVAGWIFESTYATLKERRLTNRGFLRGPVIPIYGCGAMTLLFVCKPFIKYPVAVFFVGMIGASVMEYVTGVLMEAIFKVRYWDYSHDKFNLNGHICLGASIVWGFMSLLMNYFVHRNVEKILLVLTEKEVRLFTDTFAILFIVDLTLSFKAAFDLKRLFVYVDKAKNEVRLMQKRLDVLLACADQDFNTQKAKITTAIDGIQNAISEKYSELTKNFFERGIFLGNPTMKSKRFGDTLESVKAVVNKNKEDRKAEKKSVKTKKEN